MGYSIAMRPRSKKLKQKMIKFMEKNYKAPHTIFKGKCSSSFSSSSEVPTDELSYDHAKVALGFNYSCMPEYESDYVWVVLRWMTLKIGRKRKWKALPIAVPYTVYDGFEAWPVIVEDTIPIDDIPEDKRWAIYTKDCCKVTKHCDKDTLDYYKKRQQFMEDVFGVKDVLKTIQKEIERLDELWEEDA